MNKRAAETLAIVAALGLLAPSARAQTSESTPTDAMQRENAQALYKAGNDARDAGDMKTAAEKYGQAYALVPTPVIAVAWGKALIALGQLIEGRQTLVRVRMLPVKPSESQLTSSAREEAARLAAETEGRIGTVTLKLETTAGESSALVTIDSVELPAVALTAPWKINPGEHVAAVTLGDASAETRFRVGEGENREVLLEAPAPSRVPPAIIVRNAATAPAAPGRAPLERTPSRVPAYAALGVGGAGVVVTAVFGALAMHDQSELNGLCTAGKTDCPPQAQSTISALHTNAVVSDVALGVAVAGMGAGTVLLLLQSRRHGPDADGGRGARVEPWIGASAVGVMGTF